MPRDTQIPLTPPQAAPKEYTVDKNVELILRTVHAEFIDNGAASDWLPCVDLISDSGHTIARCCDPNVKVTAGDDADVTWFPDVKPSPAASVAPSSTGLSVAAIYSDPSGVAIAATGGPVFVSLQDGVANAGFSTTDSATFANLSSTLFTGAAVYGIGIQAAGTYAVFNSSFTYAGGAAGHKATAYWAASNGSAPSFFQQGRGGATYLDAWDAQQAGVGPHLFEHEWMTVTVGQTPAVLAVWGQVSGAVAGKASFQMMVVRLSPSVLAKL